MKRIILYSTTLLFLLFISCSYVSALANSTGTNNTEVMNHEITISLNYSF